MYDVSGRTLMMSIQAVDAELARLRQDLTSADGDDQADIQELMLSYSRAAEELKEAYLDALKRSSNLPPYANLVGRDR